MHALDLILALIAFVLLIAAGVILIGVGPGRNRVNTAIGLGFVGIAAWELIVLIALMRSS